MASGLVAEWHFDGNAQDSSGNGITGLFTVQSMFDGIKGQALAFDGMDNYFWSPVSDALNSVVAQGTVLAWVNFSDNYLIKENGTTCSPGSRSLTILEVRDIFDQVAWLHRLLGQDAVRLESG